MIQLIAACALLAQTVPPTVAFQGRLTNASSAPVNGATTLTFRIYDVPSGGLALWSETQTPTVVSGVYSVHLGDVVALTPAVLTGASWLSVQVAGDVEMTPRYRISATAYAQRAQNALGLQGLSTPVAQLNQLDGLGAGVTAANLNTLTGGTNADALHAHDWASITNKPGTFPSATHTHAAADITSGLVALNRGGSGANLSASGGAGQYVKQSTAGGALTVGALAAGDLTGTVAVARGGTGAGSAADARTNLGAAASGANGDITSLSALSTPLSIGQGGTGSAAKNFVDLSTAQSVGGVKTFTGLAVANTNLVTSLNADLLDGLSSAAFAGAIHNHNGEVWTTSAAVGLRVTSTPTSGIRSGVEGETASDQGRGVVGTATSSTGATAGVLGSTASGEGTGVLGQTTNLNGTPAGVVGETAAAAGFGVLARNQSGLGSGVALQAISNNLHGAGVNGVANGTGASRGVAGSSAGDTGRGVTGQATDPDGATYGVYGEVASPNGWGLYTPNRAHVGGVLTAGSFVGDGSALTNLPAPTPGAGSINDTHIVDLTRSLPLPLLSFVFVSGSSGPITWNPGNSPWFSSNGDGPTINWPNDGSSAVGTSFVVPADYVSGGAVRIHAFGGVGGQIDHWAGRGRAFRPNVATSIPVGTTGGGSWDVGVPAGASGVATLTFTGAALAPGDALQFSFNRPLTTSDIPFIYAIEFRYTAKQ